MTARRSSKTRFRRLAHAAIVTALALAASVALCAPAVATTAEEPCPNETLRHESLVNPATKAPYSTQLSDCRAYELTSPPGPAVEPLIELEPIYRKESKSPTAQFALVTRDGEVIYRSEAQLPETGAVPNGRELSVFSSARGPLGWKTTDLTPFRPVDDLEHFLSDTSAELFAANADGTKALIATGLSLTPEDQDGAITGYGCTPQDFYIVSTSKAPVLLSHGRLERLAGHVGCVCIPGIQHAGRCAPGHGISANAGLTAVGFRSGVALNSGLAVYPGGDTAAEPLERIGGNPPWPCYSWLDGGERRASFTDFSPSIPEGGEDECEQLGMLPDGRPVFEGLENQYLIGNPLRGRLFVGAVAGSEASFPEGASQISGATPGVASYGAVSPDGTTVYVTTSDHLLPSADTGSDVYAVGVSSAPWGAIPPPEEDVLCLSCGANGGGATFAGQSTDGSHVFFSTPEGLWSWDANSATATKLTGETGFSALAFSANGQYAVGATSEGLSELTAGSPPRLIVAGESFSSLAVSDSGLHVVYGHTPAGGKQMADEWDNGQVSQLSPLGAFDATRLVGTAGGELQDVFFIANQPLTTQDLNAGMTDIYDARAGGGFPAVAEPPTSNSEPPNPSDLPSSPYPSGRAAAAGQPPALPPDSSSPSSTPSGPPTRAQKLARALRACHRLRSHQKRVSCEKQARRKYGRVARKRT
jgi:hypothetical protein